ncbi:MAG: V-type ATP synthase subunit E [Eubacteriales bacterium]|nr:V-type ATP synthase subunit E [Eubacteriales bacterium]
MAGLDNLVNQITLEAKAEADKILTEARERADAIRAEGAVKTEKEIERMRKKATDERDLMKERLKSNAQLKARNNKLAVKQEVIQRVFDEVLDELKNMDDTTYVDYVKKNLTDKAATVIVAKDKAAAVKKGLPDCKVLEDRFVETGFIEVTDEMEKNFTFDAKLALIKEEIEGQLAQILYGKE